MLSVFVTFNSIRLSMNGHEGLKKAAFKRPPERTQNVLPPEPQCAFVSRTHIVQEVYSACHYLSTKYCPKSGKRVDSGAKRKTPSREGVLGTKTTINLSFVVYFGTDTLDVASGGFLPAEAKGKPHRQRHRNHDPRKEGLDEG